MQSPGTGPRTYDTEPRVPQFENIQVSRQYMRRFISVIRGTAYGWKRFGCVHFVHLINNRNLCSGLAEGSTWGPSRNLFYRRIVETRRSFHGDCGMRNVYKQLETDEYARIRAFAWQTWWLTNALKLALFPPCTPFCFWELLHPPNILPSTQLWFNLERKKKKVSQCNISCHTHVVWSSRATISAQLEARLQTPDRRTWSLGCGRPVVDMATFRTWTRTELSQTAE